MVDATHKRFTASDRSYHAIIKKEAHNMAVNAGFDEKATAELDLILAEITSNLHKYTKDGEILVGHFNKGDEDYIELISIDNGPGIADLQRVMSDGFSSSNTMGHGLGSIKRLSDKFEVYSHKGWGTILLSRVYKVKPEKKRREKLAVTVNAVVVAKPSEVTSGDGFYFKTTNQYVKLLVADGLGHGPEANKAVNEAVKVFKQCPHHSPTEIIRYIHPEVRKTRGLVGTVVVFDLENRQIEIAGVGNISAKLLGGVVQKAHLAYNGIIGHNIPNTMNDQVAAFADFNQLILCSDGIRSRWEPGKLPGISRADASIQAAAIYKDFGRQTDDMSVVIAKF